LQVEILVARARYFKTQGQSTEKVARVLKDLGIDERVLQFQDRAVKASA
jgi:hypothetical protein